MQQIRELVPHHGENSDRSGTNHPALSVTLEPQIKKLVKGDS